MSEPLEVANGGWDLVPEGELRTIPPMGYILPTALIQEIRAQVSRAAVVREALSWLGTPYHHQARVKGAGTDCGQFLAGVFEAVGAVPPVAIEDYPHDWHLHRSEERYLANVERFAHRVDREPRPGDIVLYRFDQAISHGAIVVDWPVIVHAYLRQGVVLDEAERNHVLRAAQVGLWSVWED